MPRIPAAARDTVPTEQQATFDEVMELNGGSVRGPSTIMINVPEIAKRARHLMDFLRRGSTIPVPLQELAMLTTARAMDCQFIWYAHAPAARKAGIRDEIVDDLRDKKALPSLSPEEAAIVNYGQEYFRTRRVSQANFDAAVSSFGVRGTVELTNLFAYYALLAFNINAFEVGIPDDNAEPALPV